ncbi:MurR/RpiR family transcriptional regulator [Cryobacterium tagatosivorans]|uniref:MurR/RpiR family transcriptional regulator n=1 Tax=Cryobacterium tagatosivorans TaxID=1259199 RepID=A0A4R8UF10_9MICO|nr:MurR/RpiR family transcriptional regulator [Cryobacterium tagatosivorans]TFB52432.1 MurR/RpiR family transcriptional regulator [Cryobacterium tagatosivorans]
MDPVSHLLRSGLTSFPRAERRVAAVLLANYPAAGLGTVAAVAKEAGVSAPTVLRLVQRVGIESYPAFQRMLLKELDQHSLSPLRQIDDHAPDADAMTRSPAVFVRGIDETLRTVDPKAFVAAVNAISSPRSTVYATGGRFSSVVAKYLVLQLEIVRPGAHYLGVEDRPTMLADFGRGNVIVAIDLRRYQQNTINFGREAKKRGATLILITDKWQSPLADSADHVLSAQLDAPHPLDSLVPAMALIEAIVAGVVDRLGDQPLDRLKRYDVAWTTGGFPAAVQARAEQG